MKEIQGFHSTSVSCARARHNSDDHLYMWALPRHAVLSEVDDVVINI